MNPHGPTKHFADSGFDVRPRSGLRTDENGGSDTFTSADAIYQGLDAEDVTARNQDNDRGRRP